MRLRQASGLSPSAFAHAIAKELGWQFGVGTYLSWERDVLPPVEVMRVAARIAAQGHGEEARPQGAAVEPRPSPDLDPGSWSGSTAADSAMVTIDAFRVVDRRIGGGYLYTAVISYLKHHVGPRLLAGGRNVFAIAASLTGMAGWMAHDAGRQRTAAMHFEQAGRLARAGGVEDLAGDIDAAQAHLALYLGKPADALAIAQRGRQHVSRAPRCSGLVARLLAMEACAAATLGRKTEALRLLHRSEVELSRSEDPSPLVSPYDEASLASERARCLYLLGDHSAARQSAEHVLAIRPSDHVRSRAFAQLSLALIAMAGPRPDVVKASTIGMKVLHGSMALASARVVHQLDELRRLLMPHRAVREVADFLQQAETILPQMKITYQLLDRGELAT
ncbi:MAG TPA: hypothetical protein VFD01_06190 [Candidatus Dormibacteraeota bacterium]|nr:hypothetical protein [Candidatus Dormibacteraeota bacterium]